VKRIKVDVENLSVGDIIEVSVGGVVYDYMIDAYEKQIFVEIGGHNTKHENGEYDMNKIKMDYQDKKLHKEKMLN